MVRSDAKFCPFQNRACVAFLREKQERKKQGD